MKVLMLSKNPVVGAYHAKLREMSRLGVDLTVVAPPGWDSQQTEDVKPDGYEFLIGKVRFAGPALGRHAYHLHYYPGISRLMEREKWDLVHIDEEPFNFCTYHALRACRRAGLKALFSTSQNIMKRYPPPFSFFEGSVFEGTAGAAAISTEAMGLLRRKGFTKPVAVIPHSVDHNVFRKRDARPIRQKLELDGQFVFGYVGRISPEKDLDTLVNALALLPEGCILLFVGSGQERPRLEAMIEGLGLSARVRWVPWVASHQVSGYMNALDVLVLPTRISRRCTEKFGRVLIEAMACETCVIGSDSGEIPRVMGEAGLVFHEGDERQLAERLRRLMEDPVLRETLQHRGRERVLRRFTRAKIARETVAFYREICSTVQPARRRCSAKR
jgi:glycosyltransferase involved in cell wall biosynthesis